jgi:hypothetical protein
MTRRIMALGLFVIAAAIALASLTVPVREKLTWIDTVTGATRQQTRWRIGARSPMQIDPSPLTEWVIDREGAINYNWKVTSDTSVTLWGRNVMFACDTAPPIYGFQMSLMADFIKASTDDEIRRFIHTMRHGAHADQTAAVVTAMDKGLHAMLNQP